MGNNNGQLRIATPPRVAHAKSPEVTTTKLAYISSSYAKILGETNFQPQEFHRHREKTEREEVSVNNGQLCIANATLGGARKRPEPICSLFLSGPEVV